MDDLKTHISFKNVSKSYKMPYGLITPLKEVSFSINKAEALAIMGPSGSGKTTLLSLLGCLDRPTSGQYFFGKNPVYLFSENELSALRGQEIAFVFQDFQLISEMTVLENVLMPFRYKKNDDLKQAEKKALKALEKVNLSHRLHHYPYEISGGEMQRCAFARAMADSPSLILADEPTGNLDSKTAQSVLDILFTAKKEGSTVIVVTHDEELSKRFPRIIRLKDGVIVSDERS